MTKLFLFPSSNIHTCCICLVSKPEPEKELESLAQEEVLDAVSASKELPIFDFEDEDETR